MRSAEGFGLHTAHLVCNSFRPSPGAAKGSERWLELELHKTTPECISVLRERGFKVYVCDLDDDALSPWEVPVDQPLALLFGSESSGVSEEARALADGFVKIPMVGVTQSLNVSAAAAVVLNHVCERALQVPANVGITGEARERFLDRIDDETKTHVYWA
jgi:tRNA (guanosine-2'-O-)-methyltransferase